MESLGEEMKAFSHALGYRRGDPPVHPTNSINFA
jgi:hypothetical protein